ncbi:MAG: hypothetical protein NZ742_07995 [Acidobacteria bacterium]|nr:hypothetical protein [Acidobacteriota bacterium]MDW7984663.1 hypothetical protein [Acidobacteriota bacterium]
MVKSRGVTLLSLLIGIALSLMVLGTVLDIGLQAVRLRRRQQVLSAWWQTQRTLFYWTARDLNARLHTSLEDPVVRGTRQLRFSRLDEPDAPGVTLLIPDGRLLAVLADLAPVWPSAWRVRFWELRPDAGTLYIWCQPAESPEGVLIQGRPIPPNTLEVRAIVGPPGQSGQLPVGTRLVSVTWTAYEVESDADRAGTYRLYRRHQGGRLRLADSLRDCQVEAAGPLHGNIRCLFPAEGVGKVDPPVLLVFNDRLF